MASHIVEGKPAGIAAKGYWLLCDVGDSGRSLVLLLMRIVIGYESAESGWGHLHHFSDTVNFFASLHIPMPTFNAAMAGTAELVGGILLIAGFASRIVGVVLTINFAVAILSVELSSHHDEMVHFVNNLHVVVDYILADTAFPFFMTALFMLVFGPGWYSIDGIIRYVSKRHRSEPVARVKI